MWRSSYLPLYMQFDKKGRARIRAQFCQHQQDYPMKVPTSVLYKSQFSKSALYSRSTLVHQVFAHSPLAVTISITKAWYLTTLMYLHTHCGATGSRWEHQYAMRTTVKVKTSQAASGIHLAFSSIFGRFCFLLFHNKQCMHSISWVILDNRNSFEYRPSQCISVATLLIYQCVADISPWWVPKSLELLNGTIIITKPLLSPKHDSCFSP